jgi:hypothetical protein
MSTSQTFQKYDSATLAHFKDWAQSFGTALTALGWVQASDTSPASQVNWGNVVDVPANNIQATTGWRFDGTWVSGNNYNTSGGNDMVMYDPGTGAVCYQAIRNNTGSLTKAIRQTSQSFTITSVDNHSGGNTVYHGTITGGASNAYANWYFTVSGCDDTAHNDGTFFCNASTATTITLVNNAGVAETSGGTPTCVASGNYTVYIWGATIPGWSDSDFAGQSFTISGFTLSSGANNGTFTCVASGFASSDVFVATNTSGVNEVPPGGQAGIVSLTTPSVSSAKITPLWAPYYYEIWRTNGPLNATSPIYLRLVYYTQNSALNGTGTSSTPHVLVSVSTSISNGFPNGNVFNGAASSVELSIAPGGSAGGSGTYECDFSGDADTFSMHMWRDKPSGTWTLVIDRGKNSAGASVDTFFSVLTTWSSTGKMQTLFKQSAGTRCPSTVDNTWSTISATQNSYAQNGLVPAFPIFPQVGYIANPLLQAVTLASTDVSADGEQFTVAVYGTSHTYMASKSNTINPSGTLCPAILWE